MTDILPAIDLIDGRCVRLTKGDYGQKKVYDASPVDMAKRYADCGVRRIHLVDLDGAKISAPVNLRTLERIADSVDVELEWGGGIASEENLSSVFSAGFSLVVVVLLLLFSLHLFSLRQLLLRGSEDVVEAKNHSQHQKQTDNRVFVHL